MGDDVLQVLAHDVEYRIREVAQEASKYMFHAHRTKLSVEDINYALQARNVEVTRDF